MATLKLAPARRVLAFTLIELLVVISIIALLIAILLPALAGARNTAKSLQCMANVRSMGQASQMFAVDFQNRIPLSSSDLMWGGVPPIPSALEGKIALYPGVGGRMKDWASALVPYLGGSNQAQFDTAEPKVSAIFRCPSDPHDEGHYVVSNISGPNQGNPLPISYAVNADVTTYDELRQGNGWAWWMPPAGGGNVQQIQVVGGDTVDGNLEQIKSLSNTMFFADGGTRTNPTGAPVGRGPVLMYSASIWVGSGEPGTLDAIFRTDWSRGKLPIADNAESEDRHRNAMNIAFADGHGAAFQPEAFKDVYLTPHK